MKIMKKDWTQVLLAAGEDRVFANAPVAHEGGRFLGAHGVVKVVANNDQNINSAVMIFGRGVVAIDPNFNDGSSDIDEVWDRIVPKDEAHSLTAGTGQLDTQVDVGDEETETFSEPGLPSPTILAEGNAVWAKRVWDHSEILTFADTSDGFKDATPDTFIPNVVFGMQASQRVQMDDIPGHAMFALGNPLLTATSSTVPNVIQSREWLMLRHLTRLIDEAWMQFAGLDETGAESPFADIAALIVELTEPTMHEETAGTWASQSFNCFCESVVITEVPRSNVVPPMLHSG